MLESNCYLTWKLVFHLSGSKNLFRSLFYLGPILLFWNRRACIGLKSFIDQTSIWWIITMKYIMILVLEPKLCFRLNVVHVMIFDSRIIQRFWLLTNIPIVFDSIWPPPSDIFKYWTICFSRVLSVKTFNHECV